MVKEIKNKYKYLFTYIYYGDSMSNWVNLSDEEVHKLLKLIRCANDTFEEELYDKLENSMLSIIKPIYNEKDILDLLMYSKLFGEMVLKCNEKNDYGWKKKSC